VLFLSGLFHIRWIQSVEFDPLDSTPPLGTGVLGAYEGGRAVVTLKGSMPRVAEAKKILLVMVADYRRSNHTEVMRLAHKQQAIALVGKNGKLSAGFVINTLISSLIHSYPLSSTCSHALSFSRTHIVLFTLCTICVII
jgi:hypothetical protein